jgi:hypothetical protein
MEPEGSLPHSKAPATWPYPEPELSSPYLPNPLLEKSKVNPICGGNYWE